MKKQAFLRGLLGFPLGVAIGYLITILISVGFGRGEYSPCAPQLTASMGSEIHAVIFQTVLCGLLGVCFAACSVIWEIDRWSIARQTGTYFLIVSLVMMPAAYLANWMEHSLSGFLIYFVIFVCIFVFAWFVQYFIWKRKIKNMNVRVSLNR